jgi:hypothetical protein
METQENQQISSNEKLAFELFKKIENDLYELKKFMGFLNGRVKKTQERKKTTIIISGDSIVTFE